MNLRARYAVWLSLAFLYALTTARTYRMFVFDIDGETVYGTSDDVFITAAFGRSLFSGHGPVWFPGAPRVEGITSPIWTAVVGGLHVVPGFAERTLGLWIVCANIALLGVLLWVVVRILDDARVLASHSAARLWMVVPVMLGGGALCHWAAEGFEVVLVALLAVLGLYVAWSRPIDRRNAWVLGSLLGLSFWTRMDCLIYWSGPVLLFGVRAWQERRLRELAMFGSLALGLSVSLLVLRYAYYGELLPNTYYLKATNWPLADRLDLGLDRDASLFPAAILVWLPLILPAVRRALGRHAALIAACLLVFSLSVAYSVQNGGDAWRLQAGHDRYTVIGAVFLLLGLSLALVTLKARAHWLALALVLCTAGALDPVMRQPKWLEHHRARLLKQNPPIRKLEREWIAYGKKLEEISKPGARIAICPAGAIVYFSHRGGVDLLGKVDPYVARLPATKKRPPSGHCWQNNPGHNKENDAGTFKRRAPEFSRYRPPKGFASQYETVRYRGDAFFVRKGTPYLRRPTSDVRGR